MIVLQPSPELQIVALYDARVPNNERILLVAHQQANLAQFVLAVCWQNPNTTVTPMGQFYWLGDQILEPPTHLFIYSGVGSRKMGLLPGGQPYTTMHLDSRVTIFNQRAIVPVLFRLDCMDIARHFDTASGQFVSPVVTPPALPMPGFPEAR